MAQTPSGKLTLQIHRNVNEIRFEKEKGLMNPFSVLVEKMCTVNLVRSDNFRRPPPKTSIRIALISMPEIDYKKKLFSSLRVAQQPLGVEQEAWSRALVSFGGDASKLMLTAFQGAIETSLKELKANVICVSELGLPSRNMAPIRQAVNFAYEMSHRYKALIVAGSTHDSRTLYNTGYLFYPGCPKDGRTFHKKASAASEGELISTPALRRVLGVNIFGLNIAAVICLDIADYATLATVIRLGDLVDMILVPCYTKKFEKMVAIAKTASKALPGMVALANANLTNSAAGPCHFALFDRLENPIETKRLKTGAMISLFDLDYDDFQATRTRLKTTPDNQMEWLFGRRDRPVIFT